MRRRAFDPKYSPAQAAAAPVIMYRSRVCGRVGIVDPGYRKQNRQPAVSAQTGLVHGFRTGTLFALKTGRKRPSDRIVDRSVKLEARDMRMSAGDRWHGRKEPSRRNRPMNGREWETQAQGSTRNIGRRTFFADMDRSENMHKTIPDRDITGLRI